jgi:hypothetical protein
MISVILNFDKFDEFYVRDSVKNIIEQTYNNLEIIINYNFKEKEDLFYNIIENFKDKRIRILNNNNIEKILKECKGSFLTIKDYKDRWLPNKLSIQMESFNDNKELKIVTSNLFFCDKLGRIKKIPKESELKESEIMSSALIKNNKKIDIKNISKENEGYYNCKKRLFLKEIKT